MGDGARYGGFTLRTACNTCGQPVPINAPAEAAHCDACHKDTALPPHLWSTVLDELEEAHYSLSPGTGGARTRDFGGLQVHYAYRRAHPCCDKCQAELPYDRFIGTARDFCCVRCGDGASTVPAPQWLRQLCPTATQVYSVDPGLAAKAGSGPAPEVRDAAAPVVMACPQCGGSLRLTSDATRVIACQFCKTDVYLPDELWKRLRPTRITREWYVRFEGKTGSQLQREAKQQREQDRAARDAVAAFERNHQQATAAAALDSEVSGLVRTGHVFAVGLWAVMLTTLGWCLFAPETGVDREIAATIGFVLVGASLVCLLVTMFMASRPVKRRTGYDGTMMMFIVWFFVIFGLLMPVIGSIMCLVIAIKRFMGTLGGSSIRSGGSSKYYEPIKMRHGETFPLGVAYLALAVVWPAIMLNISRLTG